MKGEDLSSLPASVAAIVPPSKDMIAEEKEESKRDGEKGEEKKLPPVSPGNPFKDMDPALFAAASRKYHEIVKDQMKEEKAAVEDEMKRISNVYNEEKQKLDLTMKIQQARQRQTLQRKLFERKQGRS